MTLQAFMEEKGFGFIKPDFSGEFRRYDHGGTLNVWFVGREYRIGDRVVHVATFGDWRTKEQHEWRGGMEDMTPEESERLAARVEEMRAGEKAEREARQQQVAEEATAFFGDALDRGSTLYLDRKQIDQLYGCKLDPDAPATLLVPYRDVGGKLWGIQKILPDGSKFFQPGGKIKGCFHLLGSLNDATDTVFVAEGFATAASIFMACGRSVPVACAFNAGNLENVCRALRSRYPGLRIVVCGDDDTRTRRPNGAVWNPGREAAAAAAGAVGGFAVFPRFANLDDKPRDFNDIHCADGLGLVCEQVNSFASNPVEGGLPEEGESSGESELEVVVEAPRPGDLGSFEEIEPIRLVPSKDGKSPPKLPPDQAIAQYVARHFGNHLVKQDRDLFLYNGVFWKHLKKPDQDTLKIILERACHGLLKATAIKPLFELVVINLQSPPEGTDLFSPNPAAANFRNGTLHMYRDKEHKQRLEFRPHSPDDWVVNVLPYEYRPGDKERNQEFHDMLDRVFEGDPDKPGMIRAVRQMYGACLMPAYPHLFMCHGPGGTGKSTVMLIAGRLVDKDNLSHVPPSMFFSFHMAPMAGKLVNMDTDIPLNDPIKEDMVKKIIERRPFSVQRKKIDNLMTHIPSVHIFGGNGIPVLKDGSSKAHDRRWTFIEFKAQVAKGDYKKEYWDYCFEQSPQGILNFALEGLQDLVESNGHFANPESGKERMKEWQDSEDPMGQFISDIDETDIRQPQKDGVLVDQTTVLIRDKNLKIPQPLLWETYVQWFRVSHNCHPRTHKGKFYAEFQRRGFPFKRTEKGRYHLGLGFGTRSVGPGDVPI